MTGEAYKIRMQCPEAVGIQIRYKFAMVKTSTDGIKSPLHLMIVPTGQVNFGDFNISLLGDTQLHL